MANPHDAKQRRAAVLKAIVEEYVRSAQPVASAAVVRKMRLRVSSATVRNDMVALEDAGLITQPHASAGRVPSSLGYRQFVDELMGPARVSPSEQRTSSCLGAMLSGKTARQIEALRSTLEASEAQVVQVIAELMHSLETNAAAAQRFAGVGALLRQPEFRDAGRVHPLLAMLEDGTLLGRLRESLPGAPGVRVVIAGERTLDVMDEYSAVLAQYGDDARGHGVVGVVGPQRLPYRRAVASVEVIARALSRVVAVAAA